MKNIGKSKYLFLGVLVQIALTACTQNYAIDAIQGPAVIDWGQGSSASDTAQFKNETWTSMDSVDIGQAPLGSVSKAFVDIRNKGPRSAQITAINTTGGDGTVYTVDNRCGNLILPGERCRIYTSFTPNNLGKTPGKINITFNDGFSTTLKTTSMPITASANNLAFLKFEQTSMSVNTTTIGYTLSVLYKVLYNGTKFAGSAYTILPAKGVTVSNPTNGIFQIDPGAASTCLQSTSINTDCYLQVNFTPTAGTPVAQAQTAAFSLSYSNGAEVLATSAQVNGTATAHVVLSGLTASSGNVGSQVANPPSPLGFPIYINLSGIPATNVSISAFSNSAYSLSTDPNKTTCVGTQITGNCQLWILFNPPVVGNYPDSITLSYKSNSQVMTPLVIPISGSGVQPAHISVTSATSLALGNVPVHEPIPYNSQRFVIKNDGQWPVSALSAVTLSDSTTFSSNFDGSCANLSAGASCNLYVNFTPSAASSFSSTFSFSYNDGRATQTVNSLSASGTGTAPLVMTFTNSTPTTNVTNIDFGNVLIGGLTLPNPINNSIYYYGTTKLSTAGQLAVNASGFSSPFNFPNGSFPGGGTCVAPLTPSAGSTSCSYAVGISTNAGLTPDVQLVKSFTVSYTGDSPGGGSSTLTVNAKMTPRNPPTLTFVAPPAFNTLSVNDSVTVPVTIQYSSNYFGTTFKSVAISGAASSAFTIPSGGNGCGNIGNVSGSCTINVQFKPLSAGAFSGTLTYVFNDKIADRTITTSLSGSGSANITVRTTQNTINFNSIVPTIYAGDSPITASIPLIVFGSGSWTASSNVNSPFSITPQSCGASAVNCSLNVTFTPTSVGTTNQNVTYTYATGLTNPATLSFNFIGVVTNRSAAVSLSGANFPKTIIGQTSATQTVTITNSGTTPANNVGLTIAGTTFFFAPNGGPGSSGHCAVSQTLAAGASCTVQVTFVPGQVGALSTSLTANYTDATSGLAGNASSTLSGTGTQMIQVFAGGYQSCMINEVGQAVCWGRNTSGQLGYGNSNPISQSVQSLPALGLGNGNQLIKLSLGDAHTCALMKNANNAGFVACWGSNDSGRLGLGTSAASSLNPLDSNGNIQSVNLGTGEIAIDVAAGFEHTCVALKSGKVKCWGGNTTGQLGIDSTNSIGSTSAQMGDGLAAVNLGGGLAVSVTSGAGHSCAVFKDGNTRCWGDNFYGQLGQGRIDDQIGSATGGMASLSGISLWSTPIAQSAYASASAFTCVVGTNGQVKCFGQAGANETTSTPFYGVFGYCWARSAHNSAAQSCAANSSFTPSSSLGYLASDMGSALLPVDLNGVAAKQLSVGKYFVCAMGADYSVRCFGLNTDGQLGAGIATNVGTNASEMGANLRVALSSAAGIGSGYEHTCAALQNNTVKCWGSSTLNATGLASIGVAGDSGINSAASALTAVYDGR